MTPSYGITNMNLQHTIIQLTSSIPKIYTQYTPQNQLPLRPHILMLHIEQNNPTTSQTRLLHAM